MSGMNEDEKQARIKELEGFRDEWDKLIKDNAEALARLRRLRLAGMTEYDQAIIRSTEAGVKLEAAKGNIEATIDRVRGGGR